MRLVQSHVPDPLPSALRFSHTRIEGDSENRSKVT